MLQLHHQGFQPEMESYTIRAFKTEASIAEMGAGVTTHMLKVGRMGGGWVASTNLRELGALLVAS